MKVTEHQILSELEIFEGWILGAREDIDADLPEEAKKKLSFAYLLSCRLRAAMDGAPVPLREQIAAQMSKRAQ